MDCQISMIVPSGFKIRCKADTMYFATNCMVKGSEYILNIKNDMQVILNKNKNDVVSVCTRHGDLSNPFNPAFQVASTEAPWRYNANVYDWIWKYRKYINKKWLS